MAENTTQNKKETIKLIAAIVLGVLALIALLMVFGPGLLWSSKPTVVTASPTPTPNGNSDLRPISIASLAEQNHLWATTPISYRPSIFGARDPGRNIFAFYEPPPPTPYVPTPEVYVPPPTPIPPPPPPITLAYVAPQNVYAGSRGFRLVVHGDKFTPESRVYFSQNQLPTTYVSPQRLEAEVAANLITAEGPRQIIIQTLDGKLYSNQIFFSVQAPPKPNFQYIGLMARRHANNDTAYFSEPGSQTPISRRLNEVIGQRFRLFSITSEFVVLEDIQLGFRHQLNMVKPDPSAIQTAAPPGRGGRQNDQYQQMLMQQQMLQRQMQQQQQQQQMGRGQDQSKDDQDGLQNAGVPSRSVNTNVPRPLPGMPSNSPID